MISSPRQIAVSRPGLPGVFTDTSYTLPEDLTLDTWIEVGEALQQLEKSIGWWLGDWWRFGLRRYGEMASQASKDHVKDITGHTYGTIRNAAHVAAEFEFARRRANVPFSHHVEAATLPPGEADAVLDQVQASGLSRNDTRELVRVRRQALDRAEREALPVPERLPPSVALHVGDALALPLEDASVDLIVTSPPYALEVAYDGGDVVVESWYEFMLAALRELRRVARPSARLALNVPVDTTLGGFRPTYAQAVAAAQQADWTYRTTVLWIDDQLGKSTARGSVDSATAPHVIAPAEAIVLASAGDWLREQPPDRPSDIAHADWLEWTNGIWRFPGESRPWELHPAPFPLELPRRLIALLSFVGDVVLDPFCGSGTTALAALKAGRAFVGVDRSQAYVDATRRRLANWSPA